jgi:phage repressor protein C with HTH and peptisase S24 domain
VTIEIGNALKAARKAAGLTQQAVANALGVTRPALGQWENGSKNPSLGNLLRACAFLKIEMEAATRGVVVPVSDAIAAEQRALGDKISAEQLAASGLPTPNAFYAPDVPIEATVADLYMPLDVPVLGVSMGGDDTYFHFNGETVDHVRRPPGIAKAKRAYATFVIGDSMFPLYAEGSIVYVNPDKPPSIGDDVVLEIQIAADQPTAGYIKRLKRRTAEKIIVEQFNPRQDIEFYRHSIIAMHRVVPWNELLGI